jgi:hypothetical protein
MANPFQNINFRKVTDFLDYLPQQELAIVERLRDLVLECIPDCTEKLAYNVPFYYRHSRICFIWPGSVPWGNIKSGVEIGFCKGHLLTDSSYLHAGNRKEVYIKTFQQVKDIDSQALRQLLYEAVLVDEETKKMKRKKLR